MGKQYRVDYSFGDENCCGGGYKYVVANSEQQVKEWFDLQFPHYSINVVEDNTPLAHDITDFNPPQPAKVQ